MDAGVIAGVTRRGAGPLSRLSCGLLYTSALGLIAAPALDPLFARPAQGQAVAPADDGAEPGDSPKPAPRGAPSTAGASTGDPRRDKALVTFDGGAVTVGALEDALAANNPMMRARYRLEGELEKLVEQMVRLELLAREAEARGYGDSPAVRNAVMQNAVQILLQEDFDDSRAKDAVSQDEIKAYYEANASEFNRPAMRRASYVLLKTKSEAEALLDQAKTTDLRAFRQLARERSIDETTKLRGGDLRYFEKDGSASGDDGEGAPEPLAKAAFSLKSVGETFEDVVPVEGGFAVLKLTGIRPKSERSLAQVTDVLRMRLWREKRQQGIDALIERLKAEHKPVVNAELISLVKLEDGEPIPRGKGLPDTFPGK